MEKREGEERGRIGRLRRHLSNISIAMSAIREQYVVCLRIIELL